jgi:hypothetical protein
MIAARCASVISAARVGGGSGSGITHGSSAGREGGVDGGVEGAGLHLRVPREAAAGSRRTTRHARSRRPGAPRRHHGTRSTQERPRGPPGSAPSSRTLRRLPAAQGMCQLLMRIGLARDRRRSVLLSSRPRSSRAPPVRLRAARADPQRVQAARLDERQEQSERPPLAMLHGGQSRPASPDDRARPAEPTERIGHIRVASSASRTLARLGVAGSSCHGPVHRAGVQPAARPVRRRLGIVAAAPASGVAGSQPTAPGQAMPAWERVDDRGTAVLPCPHRGAGPREHLGSVVPPAWRAGTSSPWRRSRRASRRRAREQGSTTPRQRLAPLPAREEEVPLVWRTSRSTAVSRASREGR